METKIYICIHNTKYMYEDCKTIKLEYIQQNRLFISKKGFNKYCNIYTLSTKSKHICWTFSVI